MKYVTTTLAPVATGAAGATPPTSVPWFKQYAWTIGLVFAGAAVFYWGLYTPGLRLSEVRSWSWNHWLWLLAFCVIAVALAKLNEKSWGKVAGVLESGAIAAPFVLFFGFPVLFWVADLFVSQTVCPKLSADFERSCTVNTAGTYWFDPEAGMPHGKEFCFTGAVTSERRVVNGYTQFRFVSPEGTTTALYRAMDKCEGPLS